MTYSFYRIRFSIYDYFMNNNEFDDEYTIRWSRSYETEKERNEVLERYIKRQIRGDSDRLSECGLDRIHVKRRLEAEKRLLPKVMDLYNQYCPEVKEILYPIEDFGILTAVSSNTYELTEQAYLTSFGIALWILDQAEKQDKIGALMAILPHIDKEEEVPFPLFDLCFSDTTIQAVRYVIVHRNDDCKGYRSKEDKGKVWDDELTAKNLQHQDVPSRKLYEDMISLIDEESIQDAVNQYHQAWNEFLIRYMKCRYHYAGIQARLADKMDAVLRNVDDLNNRMNNNGNGSPILEFQKKDIVNNLKSAAENITNLHNRNAEILIGCDVMRDDICMDFNEPMEYLQDQYDQDVADIIYDGSSMIQDPYAICFASLYLLDHNADEAWFYFPACGITTLAGIMLPWYGDYEGIQEKDSSVERFNPDQMKYIRCENRDEYEDRISLNQVLFELCGYRFPANTEEYMPTDEDLARYDLNDHDKRTVQLLCAVLKHSEYQYNYLNYQFIKQLLEETDNAEKEEEDKEDTEPDWKKLYLELKQETEALENTSHHLQRQYKNLYQKYEQSRDNAKKDMQELAELREVLFNEENDVSTPVSMQFPQEIHKNTVVCGGHPNWLKEIHSLLTGNIRFIDVPAHTDVNVFRNADVIWIQHQAISHAGYYKIMNEARRLHIPVHYFTYPSARNCAEQIVIQDKK